MDNNFTKTQISNKENTINNFKYCKISSISNIYIIKLILKYQNISHALKIIKINKSLQNNIGISLTTYKIFSFYKKNKINMFDFKKLIKFSQNIKYKLKEYSSLDEIYYVLSLCMLDNFYNNNNSKKNFNIIDINMLYDDLYVIYSSLLYNFSSSFKINLFYSDKFIIDKKYLKDNYQKFINKNRNYIYGISLELYDKNIIKSIIENEYIFKNNKLLDSTFYINRIKFSKIKFSKDEMRLIELFSKQNIDEICFVSCKFTLYSIEVLSRFFSKEKISLKKLIFNDCHINNHIIEKLIYWDEKDMQYSFIKSILCELEKLDFSCNKITDLGFNQLLYFYNNKELYKKNLTHLNLSNNKLSSDSIKYLLNIENSILNNNNNIIITELNSTEKLNGLTYLDLSHNSLGEYAKYIFSWKNSTLTHLILIDCNIKNITHEKYKSNFMNIDEDNEDIEDDDKQSTSEIDNSLDNKYFNEEDISLGLNNLIYLNISENQLLSKFLKFLFYNIPKLYTIFISSCFLESNSFDEILNVKKGINIKRLILSHNSIDTQTIFNLFENNILTNVTELDLFDNNLRDEIVPYLIKKKGNIKLQKINIDLNYGIEKTNNSLLYQNYIKYTK